MRSAVRTSGTVIGLVRSDGPETYPVVRFHTAAGRAVTHYSSTSGGLSRGERVEVLYLEDDPSVAHVDSWWQLWLGPLVLGAIGGGWVLLSCVGLVVGAAEARRSSGPRATGMRVRATFLRARRNTRLELNGVHPWRAVAEWTDPATGRRHELESRDLWSGDPTPYLAGRTLAALVDGANPRRHRLEVPEPPGAPPAGRGPLGARPAPGPISPARLAPRPELPFYRRPSRAAGVGIGALFALLGLVLGGLEVHLLREASSLSERGQLAPGTVVALRCGGRCRPVVEYVDAAGVRRTFTDGRGSSPPSSFVGEPVSVLHDPARPAGARIDRPGRLAFGRVLIGLLALGFTLGGALIAVRAARREPE